MIKMINSKVWNEIAEQTKIDGKKLTYASNLAEPRHLTRTTVADKETNI